MGVKVVLSVLKFKNFKRFVFFPDYEIVYRDEFDGLSMFDVTHMRRTTLVPNTTYSNLNAAAYAISPDKKFVYLAHDSHKVKDIMQF